MDCRASLLYPHQLLDECRCSQSSSVTVLLGIILLRGYSVLVYRRGGPDDQARLHWLKITSGGVIASGLVGRSIIPMLAPSDVPPCQALGHQPRSPSAPADALGAAGALAIKVEGGPGHFRP